MDGEVGLRGRRAGFERIGSEREDVPESTLKAWRRSDLHLSLG
jgi:hypothetical protein